MRSRYTAFVLGQTEHLWRTWHPRTRPDEVSSAEIEWTGLSVLTVVDGGVDDLVGVVEFEARYIDHEGPSLMRERSTFERRGGRWSYVDGVVD